MSTTRVPRYKNHVMAAIDAAKLCIELFNRVETKHSKQGALIFNAQAWELLAKGILIRHKENIHNNDGTTITAEKSINKLRFGLGFLEKEEAETIQQVISLRNEALHNILPKVDDEIISHLLYFSLKSFHRVLKKNFKTYFVNFDKNFLAISFKDYTFYSHKVSKLFSNSKKFNTKENRLLYLLERGCKFANQESASKMKNYNSWKDEIKKLPKKSRIARHLNVYKYISKQADIRFIPVEVKKGSRPRVTIEKTKNPLAPVMVEKTDPNIDYPFFTKDLAKKFNKNTSFITTMCKKLNFEGNKDYCIRVKTSKQYKGIPKYNDRAFNYLKSYLEKNPDYNPFTK